MSEKKVPPSRQLSFDFNGRLQSSDANPEYVAYRLGARWRKVRRAVFLRANGKCEICRRRKGRDTAHLTYERIFHEPLTDLICVCRPCHKQLDWDPEHAR